jgi:hypothetical protein
MARKQFYDIGEADTGRPSYSPPVKASAPTTPKQDSVAPHRDASKTQAYREGKRAVMFFLSEEAFSQMHVILARQGRKKVQALMEELVDDWFRRENAPRLTR